VEVQEHKVPLQCYINGKINTLKYYIRPFLSIRNYSILGAQVLHQSNRTQTVEEAQQLMRDSISSGDAMRKFKEMIVAQGVCETTANKLCESGCDMWSILPKSQKIKEVTCKQEGMKFDVKMFSSAIS
jgi:thymidine phosphorylase